LAHWQFARFQWASNFYQPFFIWRLDATAARETRTEQGRASNVPLLNAHVGSREAVQSMSAFVFGRPLAVGELPFPDTDSHFQHGT
jgi:hypothetical protein